MSDSSSIIRSFSQLMSVVEDGELNHDLDDAVTELVGTLQDAANSRNGKAKGRITLTLDLSTEGGVISAATDFTVKKPKIARARSVFWVTPDNKLSRRNPKQPELPLRDVNTSAELKTI